MVAFERIPETQPHPPRHPGPRIPASVRRQQLRRARRSLLNFRIVNPQQGRLQGVALAMLAYMGKHWCGPDHAYNFERWMRIVDYYDRALRWPKLAGNKWQACEALWAILNQNQIPPKNL